jgi:hypothetical protein
MGTELIGSGPGRPERREPMPDDPAIPPLGLTRAAFINLGPVIEPRFSDARDWSELLSGVEITPVEYEPLEPRLSDEAARRAVDVALASDRVADELAGKRYDLMRVTLRSLDRETDYPLVVFYDYTDDVVLEVLVFPEGNVAVESQRYQPALTDAEERDAVELVRRDGRITDDLDTGAGIIVEEVDERSPRYGHRIVDLRFGPADRRVATEFAIVDLSSREVVSVGRVPEEES